MRTMVTGATGYIGGRLVPRLLGAGHTVRVLARSFDSVRGRPWENQVEVVRGDLLEPETLGPAVRQIDAAYYLVLSMYAGAGFAERDRDAADISAMRVVPPPTARPTWSTSAACSPTAARCTASTCAAGPRSATCWRPGWKAG